MFKLKNSRRLEATSAVVDLEGFSQFSTQPDNHRRLLEFLNFVFKCIDDSLTPAKLNSSWIHRKFLGDGALFIWETTENTQRVNEQIVMGLYDLYRLYPESLLDAAEEMNMRSLPRRIRVGIAQGEITELKSESGNEYVGFSINLAARLQSYFPQVGFLVSSATSLTDEFIDNHSLVKARAKRLKGMANVDEIVYYVAQDAKLVKKKELTMWLPRAD